MSNLHTLATISIIEAIYVIYILNYYVAPIDINPYNWNWKNKKFHHSNTIGTSLVCPFGNLCGYLLAGFILFRLLMLYTFNENKIIKNILINISKVLLVVAFILSFMNLNVVMYLIPYFAMEYYLLLFI
jgi:hypothetical protein